MKTLISVIVMIYFVAFYTGQPEHIDEVVFDYSRIFMSEDIELQIARQRTEILEYEIKLELMKWK
jgi:hypothetical protein